jgi:hypothetical protein
VDVVFKSMWLAEVVMAFSPVVDEEKCNRESASGE